MHHKDIPHNQLAAALQTSIIKGISTTKTSVLVPKNTIVLLTAKYQNKDADSLSIPTQTCGPLKAAFITQPNATYLIKMNFTNNNKDKGYWDKKVAEKCFLTAVDEKTQKSILIKNNE